MEYYLQLPLSDPCYICFYSTLCVVYTSEDFLSLGLLVFYSISYVRFKVYHSLIKFVMNRSIFCLSHLFDKLDFVLLIHETQLLTLQSFIRSGKLDIGIPEVCLSLYQPTTFLKK